MLNSGQSTHSAHRYKSYLECPRKWALDVIYNKEIAAGTIIKGEEPHYFVRGKIAHVALAAMYSKEEYPIEVVDEYMRQEGYTLDTPGAADGINAYTAYREYYGSDSINANNVVSVETEYQLGKIEYTQRFDLVVEIDSKTYIIDHKVYSAVRPNDLALLSLDYQFIGLALLGLVHFRNFAGVLVNVIGYDIKRGTARFHRQEIPISQVSADSWLQTIKSVKLPEPPATKAEAMKFPAYMPDKCNGCRHITTCHVGGS